MYVSVLSLAHTYMYTDIYTHLVSGHAYTCACSLTHCTRCMQCMHTYMYVCTRSWRRPHVCMHTYMYVCMHVCMHTYMYVYTWACRGPPPAPWTHIHACIPVKNTEAIHEIRQLVCSYVYTALDVCYVYTHIHVCIHTHTYVYTHTRMYTHIHVCIHTHTHACIPVKNTEAIHEIRQLIGSLRNPLRHLVKGLG